MPDMDGIETTALIRAWEKENFPSPRSPIPIIALTANAVYGMREMFLEKGLNDLLAKPIDVFKLDEILNKWILGKQSQETLKQTEKEEKEIITMTKENTMPDEKSFPFSNIPGLDVRQGIAMTGGTLELYHQVLVLFCKDAEERLPLLQTVPEAGALLKFVTQVHALKSASSSIGAANISALASELETAGKGGDLDLIHDKLPVFVKQLAELVKNIKSALEKYEAENQSSTALGSSFPIPLLNELKAALESQKANDISRILKELKDISGRQPLDSKQKEIFEQISDEVMMAEYDNAREIVVKLINSDI